MKTKLMLLVIFLFLASDLSFARTNHSPPASQSAKVVEKKEKVVSKTKKSAGKDVGQSNKKRADGLIFLGKGRASWFGSPLDRGQRSKRLAIGNPEKNWDTSKGACGRLNPKSHYCAMRWNYSKFPKEVLKKSDIIVRAGGKEIKAKAVDWGPTSWTNRIIDLSPASMAELDIKTDSKVEIYIRRKDKEEWKPSKIEECREDGKKSVSYKRN